jgi:predicted 3-demethylubiquinone-9 3-methyltransferase (glyoxalase superfamily)
MEPGTYPFSKRFGWIGDKYGVSWQLNLAPRTQKIAVCLMFVGKQNGKSEEAMHVYTSLFNNSSIITIDRYEAGENDRRGP